MASTGMKGWGMGVKRNSQKLRKAVDAYKGKRVIDQKWHAPTSAHLHMWLSFKLSLHIEFKDNKNKQKH